MSEDEVAALLAACERALLSQSQDVEAARDFFAAFPASTLTRVLGRLGNTDETAASTISRALLLMLDSDAGKQAVPHMAEAAVPAFEHPSPVIRTLACRIMARYIGACPDPASAIDAASHLLSTLQDPDTGVAQAAARALHCVASAPEQLRLFLTQEGCLAELGELASHSDGTTRARCVGLLVDLSATSPSAAHLVLDSGLLAPLLAELGDPQDLLSCLASLQLLTELSTQHTVPPELTHRLLPLVAALLQPQRETPLQVAALDAAARMLSHQPDTLGVAAFLQALHGLIAEGDDALDATVEERGWDAVGLLCQAHACRVALAASPLLVDVARRALGRGTPPDIRVAALHALATCAGAEALGPEGEPGPALLSDEAEARLQGLVYEQAHPETNVAMGPSQCIWEAVKQPFNNTKIAAYRACTALAARPWFACDMCQNGDLFRHVLDPRSDTGPMCKWRFGVVLTLSHVVQAAAARVADDKGTGVDATLAGFAAQVQAARDAGPYGAGVGAVGPQGPAIPDVAIDMRQ